MGIDGLLITYAMVLYGSISFNVSSLLYVTEGEGIIHKSGYEDYKPEDSGCKIGAKSITFILYAENGTNCPDSLLFSVV